MRVNDEVGIRRTPGRVGTFRAEVWTRPRAAGGVARQHGVYCTSQRNPTVPAMDLRIIDQELVHAKELVQSVMEELRLARAKKES
jgi:hypothetical protein